MLRLTDLRLPLAHSPAALNAAILGRLGIGPTLLTRYTIARRGIDARKRGAIMLVYAVDVEITVPPEFLKLIVTLRPM